MYWYVLRCATAPAPNSERQYVTFADINQQRCVEAARTTWGAEHYRNLKTTSEDYQTIYEQTKQKQWAAMMSIRVTRQFIYVWELLEETPFEEYSPGTNLMQEMEHARGIMGDLLIIEPLALTETELLQRINQDHWQVQFGQHQPIIGTQHQQQSLPEHLLGARHR